MFEVIFEKAYQHMSKMLPNKSLHGPTGACHGSCSKGNSRARRAVARELKRYTATAT
jgi:hypothetical protein